MLMDSVANVSRLSRTHVVWRPHSGFHPEAQHPRNCGTGIAGVVHPHTPPSSTLVVDAGGSGGGGTGLASAREATLLVREQSSYTSVCGKLLY